MLSVTSCEVVQQAAELNTFVQCKFKLKTVKNLRLANVDVQKVKDYKQLNMMDVINLTSAVTSGKIPLTFTLNMEVKNPNQKLAAMNRLNWILLIDGIEMTSGVVEQRVEIPSGNSTVLPMKMKVDLKEVLKGETAKSIINFGLNLADASDKPTRITLKAKPTIVVAGRPISYPDYITIKNEF